MPAVEVSPMMIYARIVNEPISDVERSFDERLNTYRSHVLVQKAHERMSTELNHTVFTYHNSSHVELVTMPFFLYN